MDIRGKIDNMMVTGLLNDLCKFDPQFLEAIAQEDVLNSAFSEVELVESGNHHNRDGLKKPGFLVDTHAETD